MSLQSLVVPLSFLSGIGTAASLSWVLRRYTRFHWRTMDDVPEVLRLPDYRLLEDLSVSEETLLADDPVEYLWVVRNRRRRRAMLDKLAEQYECCYHNSLINRDWAYTEWHDMLLLERRGSEYKPSTRERIRELLEASAQSCWDLRIILIVIRCWGLIHALHLDRWRFFRLPEPAELLNLSGHEVLRSYKRLKLAIAGMGIVYPQENCQEILAGM